MVKRKYDMTTEIVMSQTPPILHGPGPTEKERKYDRQLRLWAASGQAALESASILLLNSGSGTVGVETLKNLVLPGIGTFTIVDDAAVKEVDLGVNFFLDETSLGRPRSQCCTEYLLELNPEVRGRWLAIDEGSEKLQQFLATDPRFTIIMFSFPTQPERLALLEAYSQLHKTPLVAIHTAGFYSYFSVSLPGAFPVVDTHPDETATTDLRLLSPWPELIEFARRQAGNIDHLDNHDHGHLPYVVLLLHYLERWRAAHGGANPSTYAEKTAFRRMVQQHMRTDNPEGGEENFEEAAAAVLKTLVPHKLASGLKEMFDFMGTIPAEQRHRFWIIAAAIKQFWDRHKALPLPGNIPDMKAQSKVYIELQNIYKTKARRDAAEVFEIVQSLPGGDHIHPGDVELFCKNAAFVKLINATGYNTDRLDRLRLATDQELAKKANAEAMMMPLSLLPIYLALRATSHDPSPTEESVLAGIAALVPSAAQNERIVECAKEVARAQGGELHNIAALTGGMVAQEMIKVITKQYTPIDNTCIFDGIESRCQVIRL